MSVRKIISDSIYRVGDALTDAAYDIGFPYKEPTRDTSADDLFQNRISDEDLEKMNKRSPLGKVIVNDVAEDVFDKGFKVIDNKQPTAKEEEGVSSNNDEELYEFQTFFEENIKQPLIKAYKLARLYGYCPLLVGYDDGKSLQQPAQMNADIKYLQPINKTWLDDLIYKTNKDGDLVLPVKIDWYKLKDSKLAYKYIHPTRIIHIENPGIGVLKTGVSVLEACFDDLTVLRHVTWGAGQTMWRSGNQLVTATAPPRSSTEQIESIDNALNDVNAKTAMTFPYGTEVKTHAPSGLNPEPYAKIPLDNISAATRIPISILIGSQKGSLSSSLTDARDYAGTLSSIQNNVITKVVLQLFKRFKLSKQLPYRDVGIEWNPTLTMSEQERTLVEYRSALTKRILNEMEMEQQEFKENRNEQGTSGPMPQVEEPQEGEYQQGSSNVPKAQEAESPVYPVEAN